MASWNSPERSTSAYPDYTGTANLDLTGKFHPPSNKEKPMLLIEWSLLVEVDMEWLLEMYRVAVPTPEYTQTILDSNPSAPMIC